MELAMGAMGPLFPKLLQLLEDKYVEQRGLKREVESLFREMEMVHATLEKVSRVPPERLSEPDKLWARQIREMSYDMEDAVDAFTLRVARREPDTDTSLLKRISRKVTSTVKKIKERHHISDKIRDIKNLSKELADLRIRYTFNADAPPVNTGLDPRVINLYKNAGRELVGIEKARDELLKMLTHSEGHNNESLKIISIVGSGGLGKTTIAKVVHDQLKEQSFDCCAFVSVGRNPNITNTLGEMLKKLQDKKCTNDMASWNPGQICEELREFLQGKRYNIVVDDVWETETLDAIKCALPDNNCGSKVIITTRNYEVSTKGTDVYKLQPLSRDKSRELFCKRTSSKNNGDDKLIDKIMDKCDGVPLAIIAIASLLADRPLEDWQAVYDSLIVGRGDNTRTILLYSYYDLPPYLKPCLLYLSMFPEDCFILKSTLIWRWIAEGFVRPQKDESSSLLEVGERYFDELLNRSMIQPEEYTRGGVIDGCRVHDIVLDLICGLSSEENFVTILDEKQFVESSETITTRKEVGLLHGSERKVRRLSIQRSNGQRIPEDTIGMPEVVRSLQARDCLIEVPRLSSFQACRVLSVIESSVGELKHLGKLLQLRYLEITGRDCSELPKEIGNLKSLQTLKLYNTRELPLAICELTQLMCLDATSTSIGKVAIDRMWNLVRLEELRLSVTEVDDFVVELGKLTRLRVLEIWFHDMNETSHKALIQSLNKLKEIRELTLYAFRNFVAGTAWESWEPPRQLWSLYTNLGCLSPKLIGPWRFQRLRYLSITVMEAGDMGNLALLPQLLSLRLRTHDNQAFTFGAEGFENLRICEVTGAMMKFQQGVMPRLESLRFQVSIGRDTIPDLEEINLATLVELKEVMVQVNCCDCFHGELEEAEAVVRRAVEDHPNRPTLQTRRSPENLMLPDDTMKPDRVVRVRLNARDWRDFTIYVEETDIYRYMRMLSVVEDIEASLRRKAAFHPKRPKLVMNRMNDDKMLLDDDVNDNFDPDACLES
ncbi:hypothetical protein EJB05_33937, partial [Eragrostis curvula]